jgi:hypothetical protein
LVHALQLYIQEDNFSMGTYNVFWIKQTRYNGENTLYLDVVLLLTFLSSYEIQKRFCLLEVADLSYVASIGLYLKNTSTKATIRSMLENLGLCCLDDQYLAHWMHIYNLFSYTTSSYKQIPLVANPGRRGCRSRVRLGSGSPELRSFDLAMESHVNVLSTTCSHLLQPGGFPS